MSTAVVTLSDGVQITSDMTPLERHNAVAKSMSLPTAARPNGITFGPEGHPHTVVPDATPGTIAGKAPPPTPEQLEAANKPGNNLADFDAEMRAAGKQLPLDRPVVAPGQVDSDAIDALTEHYQTLARPLVGKSDASSLATAARFKAAYEADLKAILEGRQLTAKQIATLKGSIGKVDTFVPKTRESAAPPVIPAQTDDWKQHVVDGQVDLDKLTTAHTAGYTIPRFVDKQTLTVAAIGQLRQARAAGITQEQINAYLQQDAVRMGWAKV